MALDLEAIELIKQLKARYFRAIDTADQELIRSCFVDDATVLFVGSDYRIELNGVEEILQFMDQAFNENVAASHLGHHPEITVDGNSATGIWYLHDIFYDVSHKAMRRGSALYEDRYVKTDDGWRIQHSGYERIWEQLEQFEDASMFTYRRLAETGRKVT